MKPDAGDWFTYQAEKTRPKASYERTMPPRDKLKEMKQNDRVTEIARPAASITVEERPGEFGPDTIVEKINQFWNR